MGSRCEDVRGCPRRRALRWMGVGRCSRGEPTMILRRFLALLIPPFLLVPHELRAQAPPKVASVSPLGGQRGTLSEVELRGAGLEGAYAVWLGPGSRLVSVSGCNPKHTQGPEGLRAEIKAVPDGSRA